MRITSVVGDFGGEILGVEKKVLKLPASVKEARQHRPPKNAMTSQREVQMEVLIEEEKVLDGNSASVKKAVASVRVGNAVLQWSRGNIDDEIVALVTDVCYASKVVADPAQQNPTKDAQSVESEIFEHRKR